MADLFDRRFLFVTGKGGVGKTTVTTALAVALAARGKRVLCAATNAKERFSTIFGTDPVGPDVVPLTDNIWGVNLEPAHAMEEYGMMILRSRTLYRTVFDNRYVKSFFRATPGLYEWAMLGKAWWHTTDDAAAAGKGFDVVLLDAPATGHGLDMLRVPKVIVEVAPPGALRRDAERAWEMFRNENQAGVVVVTLAEDMPVNETIELLASLRGELRLPIARVVVNGLLPLLFAEPERDVLLSSSIPHDIGGPGGAALQAGVRRAARERVQSASVARLEQEAGTPLTFLPQVFDEVASLRMARELSARLDPQTRGSRLLPTKSRLPARSRTHRHVRAGRPRRAYVCDTAHEKHTRERYPYRLAGCVADPKNAPVAAPAPTLDEGAEPEALLEMTWDDQAPRDPREVTPTTVSVLPASRSVPPPLPPGAARSRTPVPPQSSTPAIAAVATLPLAPATRVSPRSSRSLTDITPATPPARVSARPPVVRREGARTTEPAPDAETLASELRARAERLTKSDPLAAARALVELGIYEERGRGDKRGARRDYEAARGLAPTFGPALGRARRLADRRSEMVHVLALIDDELAVTDGEPRRADLSAERARALEALGRLAEAREAYGDALRLRPTHAAALRGVESVLRREAGRTPELASALAAHLERMAEAYAPSAEGGDARLSAWLHVERAGVLSRLLGRADLASAALGRAVVCESVPGAVRDAMTRHLVAHSDTQGLVASLTAEALTEHDGERAARLRYIAARLLVDKLRQPAEAVSALRQAAASAPPGSLTARRCVIELVGLLEATGEAAEAAAARQWLLKMLPDAVAVAQEHARLVDAYESLGNLERAAEHAQLALGLGEALSDAVAIRHRLDGLLAKLGRHSDRVSVWLAEANGEAPIEARVAAFLRAAEIAETQLHAREEALAIVRAAWVAAPGHGEVFDALAALLAPPMRDADDDPRGVRARLALYTQAALVANDSERKAAMTEKVAAIWEDELGQPARAIEALERVLEIAPGRRSAILALERTARRAGDARALARALCCEAELTTDATLGRALWLRAASRMADNDELDAALALVDKARTLGPTNPAVLRARAEYCLRAGRLNEARRSLLDLVASDISSLDVYGGWLEIARLDETRRKRPYDAVEALRQAAKARPDQVFPRRDITRILRANDDPKALVEALDHLATEAPNAHERVEAYLQLAETHELVQGNDDAALRALLAVDPTADASPAENDPALWEALERIYVRRGARAELIALYGRWLARELSPETARSLRMALATALVETNRKQAIACLQTLLASSPGYIPALRMLDVLQRVSDTPHALAEVLRTEASVFTEPSARAGALWELVKLEDAIGPSATLNALRALVVEVPYDSAALETMARIAAGDAGVGERTGSAANERQALLLFALGALRGQALDPIAEALFHLEEALVRERDAQNDPATARACFERFRDALALWPESLLAARGLERNAARAADTAGLLTSQLALARLVETPTARAGHLVRAATMLSDDVAQIARARELYEEALRIDPDCATAARALVRLLADDAERLVDTLGDALSRASEASQVVRLGIAVGQAALARHAAAIGDSSEGPPPDAAAGVAAVRRVLERSPDEPGALLLLGRLLGASRTWIEARDAFAKAAERGDLATRIAAHFELAAIYRGPLGDAPAAEASLRAVLALEPHNRAALEWLHRLAVASGDHVRSIDALERLVALAGDASGRIEAQLRLADGYIDASDRPGAVRTLVESVLSAPGDGRPWHALGKIFRVENGEEAAAYAAAIETLLQRASARGVALESRWLTALGLLEAAALARPDDALLHLRQAVALPGSLPDARVALGRGLELTDHHAEAIDVLREVLTADRATFARLKYLGHALAALESALASLGRDGERIVVEETRASLGYAPEARAQAARARTLPLSFPPEVPVNLDELARFLPSDARSPLVAVGLALAPLSSKILRFDLSTLGLSPRERLGPRDGRPMRLLAERVGRALDVHEFELYVAPSQQGPLRLYPGEHPTLVAPASFGDLPEIEQAFAFAHMFARAAFGMVWLDNLQVDAIDGLFLAALRASHAGFGQGDLSALRERAAQSFTAAAQKHLGRRQRRALDEAASRLSPGFDLRAFAAAVRGAEYRVAHALTGAVVSAVDYLRRNDRDLDAATAPHALLEHSLLNDLVRFALSAEGHAERRKLS